MKREDQIKDVCQLLLTTLIKKNAAYGDSAGQSPILAPSVDVQTANLVRMSDKIKRLSNLRATSAADNGESFNDTILDLAGYCVLYLANQVKEGQNNG